jgi:hypothetical protein
VSSLWFVVPAHGRLELSRICLRQLRHTCDLLEDHGIRATAVVIADDENLDTAHNLGFGTVRRDNQFVSRKFNDGIQLACDPAHNKHPADYVVPCGSDDWVDWQLFVDLPEPRTMVGFQRMAFVREDGFELTVRFLSNEGGCGIRIYHREVMAEMQYRPADEDRKRACDTSILWNIKQEGALRAIEHRDSDPLSIIDWKSEHYQLNSYHRVSRHFRSELLVDPFDALEGRYPKQSLDAMAAHYGRVLAAA